MSEETLRYWQTQESKRSVSKACREEEPGRSRSGLGHSCLSAYRSTLPVNTEILAFEVWGGECVL